MCVYLSEPEQNDKMQVSPILNDLLRTARLSAPEFLNELDIAMRDSGRWSSRLSKHTFGGVQGIVRRAAGSIEVECRIADGVWLTHFGDIGSVRVMGLPDTLSVVAVGRRLSDVIEHPLLARNAYVVVASRICPDGACLLTFAAELEDLQA